MKKQIFYSLILLFSLCYALPASSALSVKITQSSDSAVPIAIVPFAQAGHLPTDIIKIVSDDLASTGVFDLLPEEDMLAQPHDKKSVNYNNWELSDVDNIVVGSVTRDADDDRYKIKFSILDVFAGKNLATYRIKVSEQGLRQAGHAIANAVYKTLLDKPGYFTTRIAYITASGVNRNSIYRLIVADYDGHNPQSIFTSKEPIMSPAWSPDGSQIAYVAFDRRKGRSVLRVQDVATGKIQNISSRAGINGSPAWSPDGSKLAITLSYQGSPSIYTYDLRTKDLKRVTSGGVIDTEAVWAADGKTLYFTSNRGGGPQIYQVKTNGSQVKRVTFTGYNSQNATVSPDGRWLAFVEQGPNGYRITAQNLKTNETRSLTQGPLDESPDFSPNGEAIIYTTQEGGEGLAMVSLDGKVQTQLVQEGRVREPSWGGLSQ